MEKSAKFQEKESKAFIRKFPMILLSSKAIRRNPLKLKEELQTLEPNTTTTIKSSKIALKNQIIHNLMIIVLKNSWKHLDSAWKEALEVMLGVLTTIIGKLLKRWKKLLKIPKQITSQNFKNHNWLETVL